MNKSSKEVKKPCVTAKELMDFVKNEINENVCISNINEVVNGLWAEKTTCDVRHHLMISGIRTSSIQHFEAAKALHQLLMIMQENDLTIDDLESEHILPEFTFGDKQLSFIVKTREHEYEFYPIMLSDGMESEEYSVIKNELKKLEQSDCSEESKCDDSVDFWKW